MILSPFGYVSRQQNPWSGVNYWEHRKAQVFRSENDLLGLGWIFHIELLVTEMPSARCGSPIFPEAASPAASGHSSGVPK